MSGWTRFLEAWLVHTFEELPSDWKAEIVDGEVVVLAPDTAANGRARDGIVRSLHAVEQPGGPRVYGSRVPFLVNLPHRGAFSPDVAWFAGPSSEHDFPIGAPIFAVEVRNPHEYGPRMEAKLARKRADYFAAGTQVVWDVDPERPDAVRVYRAGGDDALNVFRAGDVADAEPAVPGWRFPVDELFL